MQHALDQQVTIPADHESRIMTSIEDIEVDENGSQLSICGVSAHVN